MKSWKERTSTRFPKRQKPRRDRQVVTLRGNTITILISKWPSFSVHLVLRKGINDVMIGADFVLRGEVGRQPFLAPLCTYIIFPSSARKKYLTSLPPLRSVSFRLLTSFEWCPGWRVPPIHFITGRRRSNTVALVEKANGMIWMMAHWSEWIFCRGRGEVE